MIPRRADNARENTRLEIEGTQNMRIHNNLFAASAFCLLSALESRPSLRRGSLMQNSRVIRGYMFKNPCVSPRPCARLPQSLPVQPVSQRILWKFLSSRVLSLSLSLVVIIVRKFSTIHESFSSKIYIYIYCILYHLSSILIKICLRSRSSTRSVLLFSRDRIKMAVVRTEKRIKKKVDPSKMDAHVSDYNPCVSIRTEAGRLP